MSSDLPKGWLNRKLSAIAQVNPESLAASTDLFFEFGYIDISQIEQPGSCQGWHQMHLRDAPSRARRLVKAGDVLVSTVRPYLRSFAKVPEANIPLIASTGFAVVRAAENVDPEFLYQQIMDQRFSAYLIPRMTGSNYPAVSAKDVGEYLVPVPPLDEQRRIADILQSVDDAISALSCLLQVYEKLLARYRWEVLHSLVDGTADNECCLGDICNLGRGFAFKSEDYVADGVLNFRVTNIGRMISDIGEKKFLPYEYLEKYSDYILTGDEIVLVMVGATVGKLGRVPEEVCPALLNQNMWILRPKGEIAADLLWHLAHVLISLKVHGAQGGAYSFLTKKDFLQHRIAKFSASDISPHIDAMCAMEASIEVLVQEHDELLEMKKMLAADLLSGRVRVPA
tara:strand:- start:21459 stop:22649 length:1191 start_codon:yes stop_codon:yes gene_type:complete